MKASQPLLDRPHDCLAPFGAADFLSQSVKACLDRRQRSLEIVRYALQKHALQPFRNLEHFRLSQALKQVIFFQNGPDEHGERFQ